MTTATDRTLAELVTADPGTARVLERHGLDYCCGGRRTLAEACSEEGVDPAVVVAGPFRDIGAAALERGASFLAKGGPVATSDAAKTTPATQRRIVDRSAFSITIRHQRRRHRMAAAIHSGCRRRCRHGNGAIPQSHGQGGATAFR